ncbi:DUF368 domain-containing protein [Ignavigranum ruoffiae]|uniref:DUF368 domain-containing protein n=1 Tax=Ignavigranum ruoffiae TaxID=89093 RepID=UPI0023553A4D|nr:DUF368 domain-containing protein [Ignavigranum ruoffiae]
MNTNQSYCDQLPQQNWLLKFIKGMFIGSGFILPGVSGGALAAIFGLYTPIIRFLSNIFDHFIENVKFFIPVALGALAGIAGLSWGVSYLLGNFETIILWFFIGAIVGTLPALWQQAGAQGRDKRDWMILITAFILGLILLNLGQLLQNGAMAPSFAAWMLCGFLIALGVLVPGMSPSNFIVYLGLYKAMADGFKSLDLSVILPIALGGLLTILLLAKIIHHIFERYYSNFFHFIVGVVLASTVMIIPTDYHGFTFLQYFLCFLMLVFGAAVGLWMARLEAKYTDD